MPVVILSPMPVRTSLEDIVYDRLKKLEKAKGGLMALDVLFRIGMFYENQKVGISIQSLLEKHQINVQKIESVYILEYRDIIMNCLVRRKKTGVITVIQCHLNG